jgi:Tfp pilus assembly protein PilO
MMSRRQLLILGQKFPFCMGCCIASAVLILISGILWFQNRSLGADQKGRQAEGEAVLATLASAAELKQELAFARRTTQRIAENLDEDDGVTSYAKYFYKMEESGARIDEFNVLVAPAPEDDSSYKRVPFNIRVRGTYAQVAAFVHAVESGPRLANITYFSFKRRSSGSSEIVLDLNLDLLGKR